MAMILPHSAFIHVPRTGGQWVRAACNSAGFKLGSKRLENSKAKSSYHCGYSELQYEYRKRLKCFGFVRHPVAWVASRWKHRRRYTTLHKPLNDYLLNSSSVHQEFEECFDPNSLETTVRNILSKRPGLVTRTMDSMLTGCHSVSRMEDFPYSLVRILTQNKERFNVQAIYNQPIVDPTYDSVSWSTSLQQELIASEPLCRCWYSRPYNREEYIIQYNYQGCKP